MKRILKNVLFLAFFVFVAMFIMNSLYKKIGYGYFKKALSRQGITFFTRDDKEKCSDINSYKIENKDYNNSTFYKKIEVKKNTPYKVTCMVKTENVEVLDESYKNSGAKISILDSVEQSDCFVGTNNWQKATLIFNSKQNEELSIGFMLGGDSEIGNVKGTAWFSDLQIEEGDLDEDCNWNFGCFIFKNTDVTIFNNRYKYSMSDDEVTHIRDCIQRFQSTITNISDNEMSASCQIIDIETPINKVSYDSEEGYYVDPQDVCGILDEYIENSNFDHIFICVKLNDEHSCVPVHNWIGLGSMEYRGIGFSDIKLPTSTNSYEYIYDENINKFPEEVFIHEFLHTLERNSKKYSYSVPALHDYEKYGYNEDNLVGLYDWYKDYMTSNIGNEKLGLSSSIYKLKPPKEENFSNGKKLEEFKDVRNIVERLSLVLKTINK